MLTEKPCSEMSKKLPSGSEPRVSAYGRPLGRGLGSLFGFTFAITGQQGNRFAGESSSGEFRETLVGALRPDNEGGVILDDDGRYDFTLRDADTLDLCYSHSSQTSRVVACYTVTRAR